MFTVGSSNTLAVDNHYQTPKVSHKKLTLKHLSRSNYYKIVKDNMKSGNILKEFNKVDHDRSLDYSSRHDLTHNSSKSNITFHHSISPKLENMSYRNRLIRKKEKNQSEIFNYVKPDLINRKYMTIVAPNDYPIEVTRSIVDQSNHKSYNLEQYFNNTSRIQESINKDLISLDQCVMNNLANNINPSLPSEYYIKRDANHYDKTGKNFSDGFDQFSSRSLHLQSSLPNMSNKLWYENKISDHSINNDINVNINIIAKQPKRFHLPSIKKEIKKYRKGEQSQLQDYNKSIFSNVKFTSEVKQFIYEIGATSPHKYY